MAFLVNANAQGLRAPANDPGVLRLSEIIGIEVLTPEGRRLGRITDLYFDRASGSVEEVAVGSARYPISALLSGDQPGQVLLAQPLSSSAGATAPQAISPGKGLSRASGLGSPEAVVIDLLQGRVRPGL